MSLIKTVQKVQMGGELHRVLRQARRSLRETVRFLAMGGAFLLASCSVTLNPYSLSTTPVLLPGASGKIAFDELTYDPRMSTVIVPAGGTGVLALIDPDTLEVRYIPGFTREDPATNKPAGTTSAAVGRDLIFAIDRGALKLNMIDPAAGKIVGSVPVQATPDVVRFISVKNEVWVTEPEKEQIEVFTLSDGDSPQLTSSATISVPKGPESLLLDRSRGLAYTNLPEAGATAVIQVQTRGIIDQWGNGCSKARGMALDEADSIIIIACNEGKVVLLDAANEGQQITSQTYGGEIDSIAYNPDLRHIYLPSGASAIMAIFEIRVGAETAGTVTPPAPVGSPTPTGAYSLVRLGTADTNVQATCVTTDDRNNVWVCDPNNGQLLLIRDTFPGSQ
jgi:hypothetical protein